MTTLHLIDASIYVFRAYHSMPPNFYDQADNLVHAVYGYTSFLLDLRESGITHASVAFDESLNTCFRNEIYPEYKANRESPDENIKHQFVQCKKITRLLGFNTISLKEYEADDIIGSLCKQVGEGVDIAIVSRDKDLGQLLRNNDTLWDFANNDSMGPAEVEAKFGVPPSKIADFLALAGDTVDNIPGAPGIGTKTAASLIQEYGSLKNLLEAPERVLDSKIRGAKRLAKILVDNGEMLRLYRKITEIYCDIPLGLTLSDLEVGPPDPGVDEFCEAMKLSGRTKQRIHSLVSQQ